MKKTVEWNLYFVREYSNKIVKKWKNSTTGKIYEVVEMKLAPDNWWEDY